MPLLHGQGKEVFDQNVRDMVKSGHDPKQAVAASYRMKRKSGKKKPKKPFPPPKET